jgi:Flp pilus assembly protein TadD
MAYIWMYFVGLAKLHLGKYEQGVAWFRRAIEANRNYPAANFNLAAALAQLGRLHEVRSAVLTGLALNRPTPFSVSGTMTAQLSLDGPLAFQLSELCGKRQPAALTRAACP